MDLFIFYPRFSVLICKPCGFAVPPSHLRSYIVTRHSNDACRAAGLDPAYSKPGKPATTLADLLQEQEKHNLLDPRHVKIPIPSPTEPPLPELKLYRGYQCSRCNFVVTRTKEALARL
jgi:hypothetical protein